MRKITEQSVNAFVNFQPFKKSNVEIRIDNPGQLVASYYLFGNKIAGLSNGLLMVSNCGWDTPTTRDRINGILSQFNINERVYILKGTMMWKGQPMGSKFVSIPLNEAANVDQILTRY